MKSYTDLEQSKVLSKILPFESADMSYSYYHNPISGASYYEEYPIFHMPINKNKSLPCWSLAALLGVFPESYQLTSNKEGKVQLMLIHHLEKDYYDNPIDACYEMIIKLHEQKPF